MCLGVVITRRLLWVGLVVVAGCGGVPPMNEGPVDLDQMADAGVVEDAGAQVDAGQSDDAGASLDAGTMVDAGAVSDGGAVEQDAGSGTPDAGGELDAGMAETDAGAGAVDAGVTMDAGVAVDAGAVDAGSAMDAGVAVDAGVRCTMDQQCLSGEACVFNRCVGVAEQTTTYALQYSIEGIAVAYDDQSAPKVGWAYNDSAISGYSHFVALGPFGTRLNANSGLWSSASWSMARESLKAPWLGWVTSYPGKYGVALGSESNAVIFNNNEHVVSHATARNAAGDEFIAALMAVGSGNTTCEVRFAKKPAGGAWTTPSTIFQCQDEFTGRLAMHVLANGTPSILLSEEGAPGTIKLLKQSSPLSWTATSLLPNLSRPGIVAVQLRDGVSEVLMWNETFSSSASNGDYDVRLLRFEDGQITRTVQIGNFPVQSTVPFQSFDVAADGSAYLLRALSGPSSNFAPINVTRVDGATGAMTTQTLGTVVKGPYSKTAIGVSAGGEISILHAQDLRSMLLRRLTPR
ncbi:MAG: hypothetical protein U0228_01765 [Myxococcaceae bacterium]